jgi:DNA-binding response OmpR family regulator
MSHSPSSTDHRTKPLRVLVVEDEEFLQNLLTISLKKEGYIVQTANDGIEALERFAEEPYDLILLDIMMPRLDGFLVCKEVRMRSDVPIVMLTALSSSDDVVRGFELGADDFISKPFTFKEVQARIQAILRRIQWARQRTAFSIVEYGDIYLNDEERFVSVGGDPVHLTPIEYQLLYYLMSNADRPVPKDVLFKEVWGYDFDGGTNLVEVAMRRLREKIERDPSSPQYLKTVRGVGYKFVTHGPSERRSQRAANVASEATTSQPSRVDT